MKRVIAGKIYNTETAKLLGEYEYSNKSDFHYLYEALYKSPKGTYFIQYEGGPATDYAVPEGNNRTSGSCGIQVLWYETNARMWAEEHMSTDKIIKEFGNNLDEG